MKRYPQFKLKVFDFTLAEMVRVVKGYLTAISLYSSKIRVDSLYDILRRKGWEKPQVNEFISTLEDKIKRFNIGIEYTDVDLRKYNPDCVDNPDEIRLNLAKYKPQIMYTSDTAFVESQNHDLASICLIRKKREKLPRKIENSEYIFLTSDLKLSKFNLEIFGHKNTGTIPEVIPDRLLATILWLKDPTLNPNLPVYIIIASYSNTLLISRGVWRRFYQILLHLKEEGKISKDDIATLFYHNYIETVLLEFSEEEIAEINEEFVLKSIEEATKKMEKNIEKRKEKEIKSEYEYKIRQREQEAAKRAREEEIIKIKEIIKEKSKREARWYSICIIGAVAIGLPLILYYYLSTYFVIGISILSLLVSITGGYHELKDWLCKRIETNKLKEFRLEP